MAKQTLQRSDSVQLSRWLWKFVQQDNPSVFQDILILSLSLSLSHTHTHTHTLPCFPKEAVTWERLFRKKYWQKGLKKSMISKAASPTHYYVMKSIY